MNIRSLLTSVICAITLLAIYSKSHAGVSGGNLDPTFGVGGKVIVQGGTPIPGTIYGLVQQADGKIVGGGYSYSQNGAVVNGTNTSNFEDFFLVRTNGDGTLDTTFGDGGAVSFNFEVVNPQTNKKSWDRITSLSLQTDGKLVAVGYTYDGYINNQGGRGPLYIAIARFNSDGSLDTTYGTNGSVKVDLGAGHELWNPGAYSILQGDGKLVVGFSQSDASRIGFALLRLNLDGTRDNSFGVGGIAALTLLNIDYEADDLNRITLQPDGKIVAVGFAQYDNYPNSQYGSAIARFNSDGSLDTGFGTNGIVFNNLEESILQFTDVQIDANDKIVCSGDGRNPNRFVFLMRYNSDGTRDSTFGASGIVNTTLYPRTPCLIRCQTDGKYVIGLGDDGTNTDFATGRYNADGTPDLGYGTHYGYVDTDFGGGSDNVYSMLLQSDGKVVLAGDSGYTAFARYDVTSPASRVIVLSGNLAFGNVVAGSSKTLTLTINNTGDSPLNVTGITYPVGFSGVFSGSIAAGGSQIVNVLFNPAEVRDYSGTVTVNADQTGGTFTAGISGTGDAITRIMVLTGNLQFGRVKVNKSKTLYLTIINGGNSPMVISKIVPPRGFISKWSGTLAPGASHKVSVKFTPTSKSSRRAYLNISSDKSGGSSLKLVTGTGI